MDLTFSQWQMSHYLPGPGSFAKCPGNLEMLANQCLHIFIEESKF